MQCLQAMKHDYEFVSPGDNIHKAARIMRDRGIGFLPVCDENRRPIGTLTDRDIAVRVAAQDERPSNIGVRDVMTSECVVCSPNDNLHEAEARMAESHKSRIMCVNGDGQLVGIISLSDVIEREEDDHLAAYTLRLIAEREARPTVV